MSSKKIPYQNFSKYILRTPLFPIGFYKSIAKKETTTEDELKTICKDKRIQEAIFLASPDLFSEIKKWLNGTLNIENSERLQYSVMKYLSRMSSRCTPFGLFAGTNVGEFTDTTEIELKNNHENKRHTRLDMNYLVALTQSIVKIEAIRNQLKFHTNTSLYKVGHQLRYVEYTYVNTKRVHHIVGVTNTWYLEDIIKASKTGKTIKELAELITSNTISFEDAFNFTTELIESQILISELEPSVSGPELLDHILNVLNKLQHTEAIISTLETVKNKLLKIDKSITNDSSEYIKIGELLKPLGTSFQLKYLFQTDMIVSSNKNTLDHTVIEKIKSAFSLLNKLSIPQNETGLSKFKTAFFERYETKPVALSKALDRELGIGFIQDNNYGDVNTLVDDLNLPPNPNTAKHYTTNTTIVKEILHRKVIECLQSNTDVLILNDEDFNGLEDNWNDLPDTMSSMVEIITINGEQKIGFANVGGSSAANLLGRFCHGDSNINTYVKQITAIEKQINKDKLLAEIVHLPESRVGNILFRPHLRDYEIPYLANSTVKEENQIQIDDLEIIAKSPEQLSIRSKKHNKEVIPRLSNAHNYNAAALPVYQFLASIQNIDKRNGIGFSWGDLADTFNFLPRVEYKGIILSYKLWNIKKEEIQPLIKAINNNEALINAVKTFLDLKNIPSLVTLKDNDNELLINFNNLLSVRMFLNTVKKRLNFKFKEFLHSENKLVKQDENSYANQIIVSFFNETKLNQTH